MHFQFFFLVYHSYFSDSPSSSDYNLLVMQDLTNKGYKPIKPETCCLAFMRATTVCLAQVHATAFAFKHEEGERAFGRKYKAVEERKSPKLSTVKVVLVEITALEYSAIHLFLFSPPPLGPDAVSSPALLDILGHHSAGPQAPTDHDV